MSDVKSQEQLPVSSVQEGEYLIFKVKSDQEYPPLAEAIYRTFLEGTKLEISAIGPSAVNQAMKGIIEARVKLARAGHNILIMPFFRDVFINTATGQAKKSAIVLRLKDVED